MMPSWVRGDAVPGAAYRLDQAAGVGIVELLTELADVDVDDVGHLRKIVIPNMLGDHRPRQDPAGVAEEIFEKAKLLVRQDKLGLAAPDTAGRRVETDVADLEGGSQRLSWTAGEGAEAGGQFGEGEGLDQVVVGTGVEAVDAVGHG